MTKKDIINQLAEQRVIEDMCRNVAHARSMNADLKDLAQLVYIVLLEYDEGKVLAMHQAGGLRFFVARIIMNQYICPRSAYHKQVLFFRERCCEYSPQDYDAEAVAEAMR